MRRTSGSRDLAGGSQRSGQAHGQAVSLIATRDHLNILDEPAPNPHIETNDGCRRGLLMTVDDR